MLRKRNSPAGELAVIDPSRSSLGAYFAEFRYFACSEYYHGFSKKAAAQVILRATIARKIARKY